MDAAALIQDMAKGFAKAACLPRVYPAYLASIARRALNSFDHERVLVSVGETETVGDCRYAITAEDFNGTRYRLTVEVLPAAEKVAA